MVDSAKLLLTILRSRDRIESQSDGTSQSSRCIEEGPWHKKETFRQSRCCKSAGKRWLFCIRQQMSHFYIHSKVFRQWPHSSLLETTQKLSLIFVCICCVRTLSLDNTFSHGQITHIIPYLLSKYPHDCPHCSVPVQKTAFKGPIQCIDWYISLVLFFSFLLKRF